MTKTPPKDAESEIKDSVEIVDQPKIDPKTAQKQDEKHDLVVLDPYGGKLMGPLPKSSVNAGDIKSAPCIVKAPGNDNARDAERKEAPTSIRLTPNEKKLINEAREIEGELHFGTALKKFAVRHAKLIQGRDPSSRHPVVMKILNDLNRILAELRAGQYRNANNQLFYFPLDYIRTLEEAENLCRGLRTWMIGPSKNDPS